MATATKKKRRVNKSKIVRDWLDKNPDAAKGTAKEIAQAIGRGVKPFNVNAVRAKAGGKKKRKTRGHDTGNSSRANGVDRDTIKAARAFVQAAGSVRQAILILEQAEAITLPF